MANNRLDYWCILQNLLDEFDVETEIEDADDGESSTVEQGKSEVIPRVKDFIEKLQEFKTDVETLSFKKLKAKYPPY
jgi:hypothetical protein